MRLNKLILLGIVSIMLIGVTYSLLLPNNLEVIENQETTNEQNLECMNMSLDLTKTEVLNAVKSDVISKYKTISSIDIVGMEIRNNELYVCSLVTYTKLVTTKQLIENTEYNSILTSTYDTKSNKWG